MMRVLIVDDEPLVRERVRMLLAGAPDVTVVGEREDGPGALAALEELKPDLVFLDIQMPGLSGLEVAEAWRQAGALPVLVFVTAFDQFALDAFRLQALDYLTKPLDPERFQATLARARSLVQTQDRRDLDQRVEALLDLHARRAQTRPHLVVREEDRYRLVATRDIHALEATGNYVCLHVEGSQHFLRGTLASVEARLDPQTFLRTHRSWIVNLDQVREAQPVAKGAWVLITRMGLKVPVGAQHREALGRILG